MSKNITYHQTAAMAGRRQRRDSAAVAGAGLAGLALTRGAKGLEAPAKVARSLYRAGRTGADMPPHRAARGALRAMDGSDFKGVDPIKAASQGALGVGAVGVGAGEIKNVHHTRAEQKLRRQRIGKAAPMFKPKAKVAYCKKHDKMDDCAAEKVEKTAPSGHDAFLSEVSKDLVGNKSLKAQGVGFAKPGARGRASTEARRRNALVAPGNPYRKENWKQVGRSTGKGAGLGTAAGAVTGAVTALATKGHLRATTAGGALIGGELGALGGEFHGLHQNSKRAVGAAFNQGAKNGDIRKPGSGERITAFNGIKPAKKS